MLYIRIVKSEVNLYSPYSCTENNAINAQCVSSLVYLCVYACVCMCMCVCVCMHVCVIMCVCMCMCVCVCMHVCVSVVEEGSQFRGAN